MDHADGDCVVVLPRIVADQAGENIKDEQNRQGPAAGRQWNPPVAGTFCLKGHLNLLLNWLVDGNEKGSRELPFFSTNPILA
ncbi:MAG: hypothetical protein V5B38_04650 [Candidatus Accumulibacter propinquus]|jgi:hypothetical protein